ncbi:NAD(P)H-dependent oxidoreductase subunit E [Dehalobacter sp. DCM]|uniref:NADH-quinone oxidoreductase subunit NuoE family protein n=1 Tax=Dehalobacter sp. DCM TaxID=2907827 RepID=UPI003081D8CC|nr:NAD(P)H-dependent oxidoreductase subunit E [Dehalobacter sp. DCM]
MSGYVEQLWDQLPENERQAMNILNKIQTEYGFIPRNLLFELAERTGIPESQLHGLVSFFKAYRTTPAGKHRIRICYGTACYARGASLIYDRFAEELKLESGDTSADGLVTVEQVYCVGACSQAPVIIQDEEIKNRIQSYQVPLLLNDLRKKS